MSNERESDAGSPEDLGQDTSQRPDRLDHGAGRDSGQSPPLRVVDRRWWAQPDAEVSDEEPSLRKPTYVEELERQLAENATQLQSLLSDRRRSQQEFEEATLRIRRDVAREVERGRRAVLIEFFEVVDNLDRAVQAAGEAESTESTNALRRGVELVRDQFLATLDRFGVKRLHPLREKFDPAHHEAVTTTPVSRVEEDGLVIAVLKPGYRIGDDLLRPASVVVGQHSA